MSPWIIILILQRMSYTEAHRGLDENLYEEESMNSDVFKATHLIVFWTNIYKSKDKGNDNDKYFFI